MSYVCSIAWQTNGLQPSAYPGNDEYIAAFELCILPICSAYKPQLVLVSAGFDSALGDKEGQCRVTPHGYFQMTQALQNAAESGRCVVVLEGGYNVPSVKYSFGACVGALLGTSLEGAASEETSTVARQVDPAASRAIAATVQALQPFWPQLKNPVALANAGYWWDADLATGSEGEPKPEV